MATAGLVIASFAENDAVTHPFAAPITIEPAKLPKRTRPPGACVQPPFHEFSRAFGADRVGLLTFDSDIVDYVPPSAKHLDVVLHTIDRVKAERAGSLDSSLRKATELLRRRGLIAIISDLYEEPDAIQTAAGLLRHRGHDVIVFHLLDRTEIDLDGTVAGVELNEANSFEDLESGERMPVITEAVRERYRTLMQDHIETIRRKRTAQGGTPSDLCCRAESGQHVLVPRQRPKAQVGVVIQRSLVA